MKEPWIGYSILLGIVLAPPLLAGVHNLISAVRRKLGQRS